MAVKEPRKAKQGKEGSYKGLVRTLRKAKDRNRQDSKAAAQHYWPLNPGKQCSVTNQQENANNKENANFCAYTNDKDCVTDDTQCFQRREETGGHLKSLWGSGNYYRLSMGKHIYQKPEIALIF